MKVVPVVGLDGDDGDDDDEDDEEEDDDDDEEEEEEDYYYFHSGAFSKQYNPVLNKVLPHFTVPSAVDR